MTNRTHTRPVFRKQSPGAMDLNINRELVSFFYKYLQIRESVEVSLPMVAADG